MFLINHKNSRYGSDVGQFTCHFGISSAEVAFTIQLIYILIWKLVKKNQGRRNGGHPDGGIIFFYIMYFTLEFRIDVRLRITVWPVKFDKKNNRRALNKRMAWKI
jgi:hypothetical protein